MKFFTDKQWKAYEDESKSLRAKVELQQQAIEHSKLDGEIKGFVAGFALAALLAVCAIGLILL